MNRFEWYFAGIIDEIFEDLQDFLINFVLRDKRTFPRVDFEFLYHRNNKTFQRHGLN